MENNFKSGFVVLAGLPNAGKSTLLNAYAGGVLSAVTHKPQTTRQNIMAISDGEDYQITFIDTPGFLTPKYKLQNIMSGALEQAVNEDGDAACLIYDPEQSFAAHENLIRKLAKVTYPVILVFNKTDLVKRADLVNAEAKVKELLDVRSVHYISALKAMGLEELKKDIISALPFSPPYFEKGQWTDRWERFYAAEFVREQIFILYDKEIPYSTQVTIEKFTEDLGDKNYIRAIIHVERESQKPIIIGKGGTAIAKLRQKAQARINDFLGRKYRLELEVRVSPNWRSDSKKLREFGYI